MQKHTGLPDTLIELWANGDREVVLNMVSEYR